MNPESTRLIPTPHYVLLSGKDRLGPQLIASTDGSPIQVVYGFSNKGPYDQFMTECTIPLRPYPLVTGYLREPEYVPDGRLHLVVVDACGQNDASLQAARIEGVEEAQRKREPQLLATHRLHYNPSDRAYTVEEL